MSGIAGIASRGEVTLVTRMLDKMAYRGHKQPRIIKDDLLTLGMVDNTPNSIKQPVSLHGHAVWDDPRPPLPFPDQLQQDCGAFSLVAEDHDDLIIARDAIGVRPLYYGQTDEGVLCFASEVKALLEVTRNVCEFPAGCWMDSSYSPTPFFSLQVVPSVEGSADSVATHLRLLLDQAVMSRIDGPVMGCWLSGGLDSSAMAALARPYLGTLHTFASGMDGAPDLQYARQVSKFLHTIHHEVIVSLQELKNILSEVIYHLESFDALLVRSTLMNYLVGKAASNYVASAFSGEGGDELFGGYEYLKNLPLEDLPAELVDITDRLHNTALQRVDRSASSHGLVIYVPLLDLNVVEFAMRIPPEMKIHWQGKLIEKYIFRLSMQGSLPEDILWRQKSKYWQGAGVDTLLEQFAEEVVTDADYKKERNLINGWRLNSKEELLYYRLFKEHFGEFKELSWMGRTKGAPVV